MHFDQFAGEYKEILDRSVAASGEDSAYFAEYKARYLRRMLPSIKPCKVLDFGCGVGMLSGFLRHCFPNAQVDGFDVSPDSISKVRSDLAVQGTFTSDFAHLAQEYQLIVVANVMHHIPPSERQSTIDQLGHRLSAGGTLAIFEHNPSNPVTRWVVERCPFDEDAILLPAAESKRYLRSSGLTISRRDYIVFMPHVLAAFRVLEPWLRWLPLGAQYAILAEKHA